MSRSIVQISALIIVTTFYAAYLWKQFSLSRRGIKADRLAKGDKPTKARRLELSLAIMTFTIPVIQYFSILTDNRFLTISVKNMSVLWFAGGAVAIIGVIYFIAAITSMRDNWRAGIDSSQKTEFVTRGIYRMSRNPAFVGFDLFYLGTAMIYPNALTILSSVAAIILFHFQILNEEKHLAAEFGARYEEYRKNTCRY